MSFDYVLHEISYENLLLYSAAIPSYDAKKSDKQEKEKGKGEIINGDDPRNKDLVKAIIQGYKF